MPGTLQLAFCSLCMTKNYLLKICIYVKIKRVHSTDLFSLTCEVWVGIFMQPW